MKLIPFFAPDGAAGAGTGEGSQTEPQAVAPVQQPEQSPERTTPEIDYEKLASVIAGKQKVTEDTVLKSYLKQQGLTGEELNKAISSFKEQKAKNTPDVPALQQQLNDAQALALQAQLEQQATLEALNMGIAAKTIPYVLKLADLSKVAGEDGKVISKNLQEALKKVLEDVPQLKPAEESAAGFKIGGVEPQKQAKSAQAVATKRWNRFN